MKRVLMTTDTLGGVWSYSVELASALEKRGFEVALAAMGRALDSGQREDIRRLKNVELFESRYKLEWMNDPWAEVELAGEWLLSIAQFISPDVVHLNGYVHGVLDWNLPLVVVAHSCVYSWFNAVKGCDPPDDPWARYKGLVSQGVKGADYVVSPSACMLNALSENYGVSFRGRVIHNGRSSQFFFPRVKDAFIMSAGRLWDEGKNLGALSSIAHRLSWQVVVAGEGVESLSRSCMHWLGRCDSRQLGEWMGCASIYVLPARYEPFGLSVLEAALCECALVLGDIASLREIWGECALYVDPGNEEQLQDTLEMLIHKPWIRREYGEIARRRAFQYTSAAMGDSYRELYLDLINESGRQKESSLCA